MLLFYFWIFQLSFTFIATIDHLSPDLAHLGSTLSLRFQSCKQLFPLVLVLLEMILVLLVHIFMFNLMLHLLPGRILPVLY